MNVDHTKHTPSVLSFCTGYGGIEIGLERALGEINVLAHVEIEAYAIANLVAKMETGILVPAPVWTNLKTFRPDSFRNRVDILTGGYPCQPFSAAGKRKGKEDPRHLWPWIRDAIKAIRPTICFFENVEGHVSLGLREVLADLVDLGYRVESDSGEPTWGLFSAAECGAPHQRKRVFIMAYSSDTGPGSQGGSLERQPWIEVLRQGNWQECPVRSDSAGPAMAHCECSERRPHIQGSDISDRDDAGREEKTDRAGTCCKELGDAKSDNQRRNSIPSMHREGLPPGRSGGDVANAGSTELNRISKPEERREDREAGFSGIELAHPKCQRSEPGRTNTRAEEFPKLINICPEYWPARPGEIQYPWEQPRIVADTPHQLQHGSRYARADRRGESADQGPGQAESKLGGIPDGNTHRVDRLRLLGNGVVPATSERAFRILMGRVIDPAEDRKPIEIQLELFA